MAETEFNEVKDSGARQEFVTGSVRDTRDGKGRYDLIPWYPMERLAKHYENGARKYACHNWKKGQPLSRYLDSATRHLSKYMQGKREEDHLVACVWNLFGYLWTEHQVELKRLPPELNDLENYFDE
jgi:hypothetical protein